MTISDKVILSFQGKEGKEFNSYEIIDIIVTRFPETNRKSFQPSDYCYNKTNKGNNFDFPFPLFEYKNDSIYKYLGPNFPYTGKAFWKNVLIGDWSSGKYRQIISDHDLKLLSD